MIERSGDDKEDHGRDEYNLLAIQVLLVFPITGGARSQSGAANWGGLEIPQLRSIVMSLGYYLTKPIMLRKQRGDTGPEL